MSLERPLGERLLESASHAKERVVLCAPFVKEHVIHRLLTVIDPQVTVDLFTRWRPEEIAAGVSDVSVFARMRKRGSSVFLHDALHAKLYLFDDVGFIGSANLTGRALGWSDNSNLELLIDVSAQAPTIDGFVSTLRDTATPATEEIAADVQHAASLLPKPLTQDITAPDTSLPSHLTAAKWYPHLREPRDLYTAYSQGLDHLSLSSAEAAVQDLTVLEAPPGLDREAFERLVATRLLQMPLVKHVDALLDEARRFGEIRRFLADTLDISREDASYAWQTLMRWLLYLLPHRYSRTVPSHSEILVRKETAS